MTYYKNLSINEDEQTVENHGHPVHLTTMEYQLLLTLLAHAGQPCSRIFLLETAWHITTPIHTRTVDVHIARLRKKLELGPEDLKTVARQGYVLLP